MINIINLIKESNFDALGVLYFLVIIIYILIKTDKNIIEYIILLGAIIGFLVDLIITINTINKLKKNEKN